MRPPLVRLVLVHRDVALEHPRLPDHVGKQPNAMLVRDGAVIRELPEDVTHRCAALVKSLQNTLRRLVHVGDVLCCCQLLRTEIHLALASDCVLTLRTPPPFAVSAKTVWRIHRTEYADMNRLNDAVMKITAMMLRQAAESVK
jgi:hypothetical protein